MMHSALKWNVVALMVTAFAAGVAVREVAEPRTAMAKGPDQKPGEQAQHEAGLFDFMKHRLNPALTRASYAVFHGQLESDAPEYQQAMDELMRATEALTVYGEYFNDTVPAFQAYTVDLRSATRSFSEAALQGDRNAAQHWLEHIRSTCNSCHRDSRD